MFAKTVNNQQMDIITKSVSTFNTYIYHHYLYFEFGIQFCCPIRTSRVVFCHQVVELYTYVLKNDFQSALRTFESLFMVLFSFM